MKSASEEFRDELWLDFSLFSYRLARWTATIFVSTTILIPLTIICVLTIALGGGWLLEVGNHFFGSGTLEATDWIRGIWKMVEAAHAECKGVILISWIATCCVALTTPIQSSPLKQITASVGCIAVHLMLIGAYF